MEELDESSKPPLDQSFNTLCTTSSSTQSSSSESSDTNFHLGNIVRYPSTAVLPSNLTNNEPREKEDQDISTYGSYSLVHSQSVTSSVGDLNNPKLIESETKRMKRSRLDFDFGKRLGHGSYGDVFIVKFKDKFQDKENYAMKIIKKSHIMKEKKLDFVKIERDAMNRLNHPNIIRLKLTFQDKLYLYYVVELAQNGDLAGVLKRFIALSPECNKIILAQVLSAISHMHHRRVLHRDLKPENILLDSQNRVKITDFGTAKIFELAPTLPKPDHLTNALNAFPTNANHNPMAKRIPKPEARLPKPKSDYISISRNIPIVFETNDDSNTSPPSKQPTKPPSSSTNTNYVSKDNFHFSRSSFVGSADYVSPEMVKSSMIGPMSDIWAFGCLVYTLFVGEAPFHTDSRFVTFRRIQENDYTIPDFVPSDARDLIEKILITDPEKRLGHNTYDSNYEDIKQHPFFKDIDWSKVPNIAPPPFESFEPAVKRRDEIIEKLNSLKKEEEMEDDPYNLFEQVVREGPGKYEKVQENCSEIIDVRIVLTNKLRIFVTDASSTIEVNKKDPEGNLKTGPIYDQIPLTANMKISLDNGKGTVTFINDKKTLTFSTSEKERKEWDEFIKEALLDL